MEGRRLWEYLRDNVDWLFPEDVEREVFLSKIHEFFGHITDELEKRVQKFVDENGRKLNPEEIQKILEEVIVDTGEKIKNLTNAFDRTFGEVLERNYKVDIERIVEEFFRKLPVSEKHVLIAKKCCISLGLKFGLGINTGLVITGFGAKNIFPALYEVELESVVGREIKFLRREPITVSQKTGGFIRPFAQREAMLSFITGIDDNFQQKLIDLLVQKMNEGMSVYIKFLEEKGVGGTIINDLVNLNNGSLNSLAKNFNDEVNDHKQQKYITPIMDTVTMMPPSEMGALAEALVSITSLKRHVTFDKETVGGPVDVAVISKGDGFVWIKRKHYFESEYNKGFYEKYFKQ